MSCSTHPQWIHDSEDCPYCIATSVKVEFLHCNACGKSVSTGFIPIPTDTPDRGIIIRAWITCPECLVSGEKM